MSQAKQWKDRGAFTGVILFTAAFLWQLQELLKKHTDWDQLRTPPGVGEIVFAMLMGVLAVGAAAGLNVTSLIRSFRETK